MTVHVRVVMVVMLVLLVVMRGILVLQVFGARHATKRGDRVPDLCCFVVIGVAAVLELIGELEAQSGSVGNFLRGQPGVDPCHVQLLTEARSRCGRGVLHEGVITPPDIAELHDDRG